MILVEVGALSSTEYAQAISELAIRKHEYLALSAETLVDIAKADESPGLERFKAVVLFVCGQSAEPSSHVSVVWNFLRKIFLTDAPQMRRYAAANAILERLVPFLSQHNRLRGEYRAMLKGSADHPLLRSYLLEWAQGHFIDLS